MGHTEVEDAINEAARRDDFASCAVLALAEQGAFEPSAETWATLAEYLSDSADRLRAAMMLVRGGSGQG